MSEERIVSTTYGLGGYDPSKPNNNITEQITEIISDEQLAEEAEAKALKMQDFTGKLEEMQSAPVATGGYASVSERVSEGV